METIPSSNLEQEIDIVVRKPLGYDRSDAEYPLVVMVDTEVMIGLAGDIPTLLSFEGKVPPMIVAGISYQTFSRWFAGRTQFMTTSKKEGVPSGEANLLLSFIQEELLPFLEDKYRINEDKKILYGHSNGGLFVLYTLINDPELFSNYIATSPSVEWDDESFLEDLEDISSIGDSTSLYLSIGELEEKEMPSYNKAVEILKGSSSKRMKSEIHLGASHMSSIAVSFTNALLWLFE